MYWDSAGENPLSDYIGRYGVIAKGSSATFPIYFNWPYGSEETYEPSVELPKIKIIARQYTGYSGSIPMNLFGFTNLISYNDLNKTNTIKISYNPYDNYGYLLTNQYKFETITSTSGYILNGNF